MSRRGLVCNIKLSQTSCVEKELVDNIKIVAAGYILKIGIANAVAAGA